MINKLRNRLRNWLLRDYNPKTQTVRPAEVTGGAIDLIMLHQEWLEALDNRVRIESEFSARSFGVICEDLAGLQRMVALICQESFRNVPGWTGLSDEQRKLATDALVREELIQIIKDRASEVANAPIENNERPLGNTRHARVDI